MKEKKQKKVFSVMKKIITWALIIIVAFAAFAVYVDGKNGNDNSISPNDNGTPKLHLTCTYGAWETVTKSTCKVAGTQKRTCTVCQKEETKELPLSEHVAKNWKCSVCGENLGDWEIQYYVDDFNLPTNQKYIRNKKLFNGTFSNSATTNSLLYARILVDRDDVSIMLWEYGNNKVNSYYKASYLIKVLDVNNVQHTFYGTMYEDGDRVYINSGYEDSFLELLSQSGTVAIFMSENKYNLNTYLFSFDTSNFSIVYSDF